MQLQSDVLLALGCLLKCSRRSDIILPMCGHYRLSRREMIIEECFDTTACQDDCSTDSSRNLLSCLSPE